MLKSNDSSMVRAIFPNALAHLKHAKSTTIRIWFSIFMFTFWFRYVLSSSARKTVLHFKKSCGYFIRYISTYTKWLLHVIPVNSSTCAFFLLFFFFETAFSVTALSGFHWCLSLYIYILFILSRLLFTHQWNAGLFECAVEQYDQYDVFHT